MKREILTERRRKSLHGPEAAVRPETLHPTIGDSLPSPPAHIVLVPPIRSFGIRDALHHTSKATLQPRTDGQGEEDPQAVHASDPAATITEAIAQLENILEEACRLAQSVSEAEQFATAPADRSTYRRRRPSESIATKGLRYLEHAGKQSSACDPAHGQQQPTKSKVAAPHMTSPSEVFQLDHLQDKTDTIRRSKSGLEIISPRPERDPSPPQRLSHECQPGSKILMSKAEVREYIRKHAALPITPRASSREHVLPPDRSYLNVPPILKLNDDAFQDDKSKHRDQQRFLHPGQAEHHGSFSQMFGAKSRHASIDLATIPPSKAKTIDLKRNRPNEFDVYDTCSHAPVARDWPTSRKRFTAAIVCTNTTCLGMLIGIYAGEVPAIQYVIADFGHHYAILGNVGLYCGLAISTLLFWPLPLLHGRKTYTVVGLALTIGLQIPQGVAVLDFRMPGNMAWRTLLLLSRALSGVTLGLVNINLQATMLDLFGSSLQSNHPHGEHPDPYDARRHGGGMGMWLAAWSWCSIGSIAFGFAIGAFIIDSTSVDWGFWTSLLLLLFAITLNVIAPESRRSAFRRTVAELIGQEGAFSRVARGEIKMHLKGSGPYWWGEELHAGLLLSWCMIKQPGFLILAIYAGWAYAQFTLIMMLLGALASRDYLLRPAFVGLCVLSLVAGSLLAVPFQKASFFSRSRSHPPRTDSQTFQRSSFWSSHLVRRALFTVLLPIGATGYTLASWGPPFPVAVPCVLSAIVAYFSNLALAECNGLIMETFDTSDLQTGMTGKPVRRRAMSQSGGRRTNFSCYPRVSAGIAVTQSFQFAFAAAAIGVGGRVERRLGAVQASAVVAGVLLALTFLLTMVLWRWKSVQVIPENQKVKVGPTRRRTEWEPVVLGTPSGVTRKLSILEQGRQTRWSEIRRRNRLNTGLTGSSA